LSQLVACTYSNGLVLAADRRLVVERRGERQVHSVSKLFPLGAAAAVATSGAAVGIAVSRTLSRLLRRRASLPFAELEAYALSVFQKEYGEFVKQGADWFAAHPEAHRLSYVLLGGRRPDGEFVIRFYASEAHDEPYRLLPTGGVLAAPRRLGLESRLTRAAASGARSDEVFETTIQGLRAIAARDEAVGSPFDLALLDENGLRLQTVAGPGYGEN
jgi:hypothetical protein